MATELHVAAVVRTEEISAALGRACAGVDGASLDVIVGQVKDIKAKAVAGSDVLIVDINPTDDEEVDRLARLVTQQLAGKQVVATATDVSIQSIQRLMRLGIVDFLPQPLTQGDVAAALEHVARRQQQSLTNQVVHGGRVISFLKGAGGVGATTLAVQAGCAIAAERHAARPEVCVLDLDIQFGTAALYLDLTSNVDYSDIVGVPDRLDGELLHALMASHSSGLDVLGVPADVVPLETLTPEFVAAFLDLARQEYAVSLVDLPLSWTGYGFAVLRASDLIVLVANLSVAGVRQARRQLDTLYANGLPRERIKIALNRYDKSSAGSVGVKEAQQALGHDFDYVVPSDPKIVGEATNQGVPLAEIRKRSKVAQTVQRMAQRLVEDAEAVAEELKE